MQEPKKKLQSLSIKTSESETSYEVKADVGILNNLGDEVSLCSNAVSKVAVISNRKVFGVYGDRVTRSLQSAGYDPAIHLIGEGERSKELLTVNKILSFLQANKFKRTDLVIALGGGILGDVAAFSASIYQRGIGLIQVPTTLLSMIDSSVGGKTGVNFGGIKNSVGTFYDPLAVLIDPEVLKTLDRRQINAGSYEAVKHGALSGKRLLQNASQLAGRLNAETGIDSYEKAAKHILKHVAFKASVVSADRQELQTSKNKISRKVLNLGHTFGHALESVTGFERLLHGEAVGYGILMAAELSKNLDLIDKAGVKLLMDVVHRIGQLPSIADIRPDDILNFMKFDKKSSFNGVELVLLRGIGKPVIIPISSIHKRSIYSSIDRVLKRSA